MEDGAKRQMVYCNEKLSQVVQAVFTLMQMEPQGIKETDLAKRIQSQVNFEFSFKDLGCGSACEFVKHFIMPKDDSIEFILTQDNGKKTYILRSKKIFGSFIDQMFKRDQLLMGQQKDSDKNHARYPTSLSHHLFSRGNQDSSKFEPSEASSDYFI